MSQITDVSELGAGQDPDRVVMAEDGMRFTRRELTELFDRVANARNWKQPIDSIVKIQNERERVGTLAAIRFFTGSIAVLTAVPSASGQDYRVRAPGYYLAVGA